MAGSPGGEGRPKAGDVITAIDGDAVTNADDLTAQVSAHQPDDKVTLTVTRNGSSRSINVTLGIRRLALRSPPDGDGPRSVGPLSFTAGTSADSAAAPTPR